MAAVEFRNMRKADPNAAARFYAETFPDSAVGAVHVASSDYPSGKKGDV